jgi:hypothetical protein
MIAFETLLSGILSWKRRAWEDRIADADVKPRAIAELISN